MAIKNVLFCLLFLGVIYAQDPRGISYQGVVLYPAVELPGIDSKTTPYSEKDICFRFSIYNSTNTFEYSETHRTTTDYYGQVNLIIGRGDNPSILGRLDALSWDGTAKFLKVELDYSASCTNWEEISYDELNYVPFAFYALNSQSSQIFAQGKKPIIVNGTGTNTDPVIVEFDGELNDLNDVDFSSAAPVMGQKLIFDGTSWVAKSDDDRLVSEIIANTGDIRFTTLATYTNLNSIEVYRNGISVKFKSVNTNTIELLEAVCLSGDQIKIIQYQ